MERQFKGLWIPKRIVEHPELPGVAKMIWADIDSMSSCDMWYYKRNSTIAEEMGISERSASRYIAQLIDLGLVVNKGDHTHRLLNTCKCDEDSQDDYPRVDKVATPIAKVSTYGRQNDYPKVAKLATKNNIKSLTLENTEKDTDIRMGDGLREVWDEWLAEKKDRKEKYTPRGMRASFTHLMNLSKGNELVAAQIIQQSIQNGWKGFFPLKGGKGNDSSVTPEGLHDFIVQG
jgi:hypothetical protein